MTNDKIAELRLEQLISRCYFHMCIFFFNSKWQTILRPRDSVLHTYSTGLPVASILLSDDLQQNEVTTVAIRN